MTDNEIIKALECCIVSDDSCSDSCPLRHIEGNCFYILSKPILDLINRQKAEIERLRKTVNDMAVGVAKIDEKLPLMRAEAIKEFAEKIKYFCVDSVMFDDWHEESRLIEFIDDLVKETEA